MDVLLKRCYVSKRRIMFRVLDNPDGSTSVYSRESGKIICIVPQRKFPHNKPVGISRPIPRSGPSNGGASLQVRNVTPFPRVSAQNFATASHAIIPRKVIFKPQEEYPTVDYSEDCITHDEFLQTLGLISEKRLKEVPRKKLLVDFPYRNISKTDCKPFWVPPEGKLFDGTDVFGPLGEKWFALDFVSSKYIIKDEQGLAACLNKQSQFCRTVLPKTSSDVNLPKLRNREEKLYPLTFRPVKTWGNGRHEYSFNREQRLERAKTIRTGLNKKGRQLMRKCKALSVSVTKLSKKEIHTWCLRRFAKNNVGDHGTFYVQAFFCRKSFGKSFKSSLRQHPGLKHIIESPSSYTRLKSQFQITKSNSVTARLGNCVQKPNTLIYPSSNRKKFNCRVVLHNVLFSLMQNRNACHVGKTFIKVNDVTILPSKLWLPTSTPTNVNCYKRELAATYHDHAYHRLSSSITPVPPFLSNQVVPISFVLPNSTASFVSRSAQNQQTGSISLYSKQPNSKCAVAQNVPASEAEPNRSIPIIDITNDDDSCDDNKQTSNSEQGFSYLFHCFGCSFKWAYTTKSDAIAEVRKHLVDYHFVLQPELFIEMHSSKAHSSVLIEAFPGYKMTNS